MAGDRIRRRATRGEGVVEGTVVKGWRQWTTSSTKPESFDTASGVEFVGFILAVFTYGAEPLVTATL